jgi:predicted metalloprotease with PDZ domain
MTETIAYRVTPADLHAHLFEVTLDITRPDPDGQRLALPAWIPGSYLVRDFARHVVQIEALCRGKPVALRKADKHTWVAGACRGPLRLRYRVYAWDLSVRGAHLDATHGFFNGTSLFLRVIGQEAEPCAVVLEPPTGRAGRDWQVATTLPEAGAERWGFGRYRAADYDELIDHPVEMGRFTRGTFEAGGAVHDIAITGLHDTDVERLCRDLAPICEAQIALFDPQGRRAPVERYLFQVMAVGDGYGGLEHRASTALICKRADLPHAGMEGVPDGYRAFLGLASHEYFHTWNVKRIKPAVFADYDLERENYTRLLWVFEGFTSYYDDLMLARSGVLDEAGYLKVLSTTISNVLRAPGRRVQSVADSSFDAWTKYYRQDENSPNAIVSYYTKGALVALSLDLTIRSRSKGRRSLDDVMRLAWERYGREFYARPVAERDGLPEDGFPALLGEATGLRLDRQIRDWAEGTGDLPLAALLRHFGLRLTVRAADHCGAMIGAKVAVRDGGLQVSQVLNGGPAHAAGLSAGDTLVAVDGLRVADEKTLKALLSRRGAGAKIRVHAFRRDELLDCELVVGEPPPTEAALDADPRANAQARRLRAGWLAPLPPRRAKKRVSRAVRRAPARGRARA